jgi:hypothetical protein
MTAFELLAEDEGFKLGRVGNLAIVLWKTTPTVPWARRVCDSFPTIADEHGLAILTVLTPETGPPDGGVRKVFDETMKAMNDRIVGNAIVIEAGGVLGSLLRAFSRTLTIFGRSSFAIETFSTTNDATEWLVELLATRGGTSLDVDDILDGLALMRR